MTRPEAGTPGLQIEFNAGFGDPLALALFRAAADLRLAGYQPKLFASQVTQKVYLRVTLESMALPDAVLPT